MLNGAHTAGVCQHSEKKDRKPGCGAEAGRQHVKGFHSKTQYNVHATYTDFYLMLAGLLCTSLTRAGLQVVSRLYLLPVTSRWPTV